MPLNSPNRTATTPDNLSGDRHARYRHLHYELELSVLGFALALTITALLTKLVGCGLPARLMGMGSKEAWVIGIGMAPRGEVAMVIALLALNEKIIQQPVSLAIIIMGLLTTIAVPLILRKLPPRCRLER